MTAELDTLAHRALDALANGAYQGLLLTALVALALKLLPRTNAATCHAVNLATLAVVTALPILHFLRPAWGNPSAHILDQAARPFALLPPQRATADPADSEGPLVPGEDSVAAPPPLTVPPPEPSTMATDQGPVPNTATTRTEDASRYPLRVSPEIDLETPLLAESFDESSPAGIRGPFRDGEVTGVVRGSGLGPAVAALPSGGDSGQNSTLTGLLRALRSLRWDWRPSLPPAVGWVIIPTWILIAMVRLTHLARQCLRLCALKHRGCLPSEGIRGRFDDLRRSMDVRRPARLVMMDGQAAPLAVGFRSPAVLLPVDLATHAPGQQLEQVLRHELAHLRRRDDWANLFQQIVKATLFFHPAVWWLSRRLTVEREIACDDHVLAATRAPQSYALFLTEFAGRIQGRHELAAPAGWNTRSQLRERIIMILDPKRNSSTGIATLRVGALTTTTAILALLGFFAGPRLGLAQSRTQASSGPTISAAQPELPVSSAAASASSDSTPIPVPAGPAHGSHVAILSHPIPEPRTKPASVPAAALVAVAPSATPGEVPPPAPPVKVPRPGQWALSPSSNPTQPRMAPIIEPRLAWDREEERDASIERRIDRLERMIESLIERDATPRYKSLLRDDARPEVPRQSEFRFSAPQLFKEKPGHEENLPNPPHRSEDQIANIRAQAEQAAQQAAREVDRANREVQRVVEESKLMAQLLAQQSSQDVHGQVALDTRRNILEAQRKALQQQLQEVERQLDRIEEEHPDIDKKDKAPKRRSGNDDSAEPSQDEARPVAR